MEWKYKHPLVRKVQSFALPGVRSLHCWIASAMPLRAPVATEECRCTPCPRICRCSIHSWSPSTAAQTRRIAELARQAAAPGARVHLLCAVDAGYALPGRPTLLDYPPAAHECEEARQVLDEACALLAGCELEVRAELRAGDPVQVILGEARRLGCELIVIGHRHLGRLERLLDPSVGDRVIREAPCPVLVEVREEDAQGS